MPTDGVFLALSPDSKSDAVFSWIFVVAILQGTVGCSLIFRAGSAAGVPPFFSLCIPWRSAIGPRRPSVQSHRTRPVRTS